MNITIETIKSQGYKFHHSASVSGYLSRKGEPKVERYEGCFGSGYKVTKPRWDTIQYVTVEYYIKEV